MKDPIKTLKEWGTAYKAGDTKHLHKLHAEGSVLRRAGVGPASQTTRAEEAAEYGKITKTEYDIAAPRVEGEKVYAHVTERSEWLRAAGIPEAHYEGEFTFKGGRIEALHLEARPETRKAAEAAFAEFTDWVAREKPAYAAEVLAEGKLRMEAEGGHRLIELMHEWKEATR